MNSPLVIADPEIMADAGPEVVHVSSEQELWAQKRKAQARDIEAVVSGRVDASAMSWFTDEQAREAKTKYSPY